MWSTLCPTCFNPHTHCIAGWVDSTAKLDALQERKSPYPFEIWGSHRSVAEDSAYLNVMLRHCMSSCEHSEDHSAFIFRFKQCKNMRHITTVQNVKNYPPNEAVSMPEDVWLEEKLSLRGNANVSRMSLRAECHWSSDVCPEVPSCWRSETGKWEAGSWLNAIAVAKLEPVRCPAPCEIHPDVTVHTSREIWYNELCGSGQNGDRLAAMFTGLNTGLVLRMMPI